MSNTTQLTGFASYLAYKESGVPWLGEIPSHWVEQRMRFFIKVNPLKSELGIIDDTSVSFLPMESVGIDGSLNLDKTKELSDVYKGYTYFRNGDVIFAKITPCFENGKAAICEHLINDIGFGSTEFHVLRSTQKSFSKFIYFLLKSHLFMQLGESEMYGAGGQKRVPESFIKNYIAVLPPLIEQQAIVQFLDKQLAYIDALVNKQKQLIKKLAEQRSAIISHAVTKGLDPNVAMKESGVEWLGKVPEHWFDKKIKRIVKEHSGNGFPTELQGNHGNIPFLKVSDLNKKGIYIDHSMNFVSNEMINNKKWNIVPKNSLVTAKIGEALRKNHRKILRHDSIIDNNCIAFECTNINVMYFFYLSTLIDFDWYVNGGTIPCISVFKFKNQKIYIPDNLEQQQIVDYLDKETQKIDQITESTTKIITKLQEYRSALITQAVTGKIDVRDLVNNDVEIPLNK